MKFKSTLLVFTLIMTQMYGQKTDSITASKKRNFKPFIIPTILITRGALFLYSDYITTVQNKSKTVFGTNFHSSAVIFFHLFQ